MLLQITFKYPQVQIYPFATEYTIFSKPWWCHRHSTFIILFIDSSNVYVRVIENSE